MSVTPAFSPRACSRSITPRSRTPPAVMPQSSIFDLDEEIGTRRRHDARRDRLVRHLARELRDVVQEHGGRRR
jgi:hypothetical protein